MAQKIGLLVGREWSFPPAYLNELNRRSEVTAEFVKLGGTRMEEPCPYAVILDRASQEVPYYRSYLRSAALQGTVVLNDPFRWNAADKFYEASLAAKLGFATPKTLVLPNKAYGSSVSHQESLRNLVYPLDWRGIVDYVGLPCVLKDVQGGWKNISVCHSLEELIDRYNQSGLLTMIVQSLIPWERFVRCLCVGKQDFLTMRYDPLERQYHVDPQYLAPDLEARIGQDSLKLVKALGFDIDLVEWAVGADGVAFMIDGINPIPDLDISALTPVYFAWAVEHLAALAIRLALTTPSAAAENG